MKTGGLEGLVTAIKELDQKNMAEHEVLVHNLGLLTFFIKEYGTPKTITGREDGIFSTAVDVIKSANNLIIGLKDKEACQNQIINGDSKLIESIGGKLEDTQWKNNDLERKVDDLSKIGRKDKKREENAKQALIEKHYYSTEVAIDITKEYSIRHPNDLNKNYIKRGVQQILINKLVDHFTNPKELAKAKYKLTDGAVSLSEETARKKIKLAFEKLGFE